MDAGPRYLEGTTVGSGRDIIGVRRDRIAAIIEMGREIIARAKQEKVLPETITGATAALLVTIAGYGEPLSEGQWRELSGVVGGIMRDPGYADLARLRTIITQEQFLNVARNVGYTKFIRRLDDGRWVCELTPKLELSSFTMGTVLDRIARDGDLFAGVLSGKQSLTKALRSLR